MSYNGWANYETWRINLECISGEEQYLAEDFTGGTIEALADYIERRVIDDVIECEGLKPTGLAASLVHSFLNNVDWREIAEHIADDWELLPDGEEL